MSTATSTASPTPGARRRLGAAEDLLARLGFPGLLVASIAAFMLMVDAGHDPNVASGLIIAVSYTLIALGERVVPWHRTWLHSQGDLRTDIGLFITNGLMGGVLTPALLGLLAAAGAALSARIGMGLWPGDWPLLAQLPLALVIAELIEYSFHRMMHEVPWLWRFHATHHSSPRLYWLNAARFHPIDLFLVGTVKVFPLALLGAGLPVFALVNLFSAIHGAYQHANLPVRLGPLNWIFSMTELHRWHHSRYMHEANHNYGGNLIVWDVVFGTRWLPDDRDPPEDIGIDDLPEFPMGFWANLAAPFRWRRLVDEASGLEGRARGSIAVQPTKLG